MSKDKVKIGKQIVVPQIIYCARCGGNHRNVTFKLLTKPSGILTHWAPCPRNGQPILMRIERS